MPGPFLQMIFVVLTAVATAALVKSQPWRGRLFNLCKAWATVVLFIMLLTHQVAMKDGSRVMAGRLVLDTLARVDAVTFWLFCAPRRWHGTAPRSPLPFPLPSPDAGVRPPC